MLHGSRRLSRSSRNARLALVAGLLLVTSPGAAAAASITVTTTSDEVTTDGDCSLREALRAANTNTAQDACPAGSSSALDTITLASGAAYSLAITGDDDAGLLGDLDIADNPSASKDVLMQVASGGTAIISQDAKPDDTVLSVAAGANVAIEGVIFTRGTSPSGKNGGALAIAAGAAVGLVGCAFTDNVASLGGGAIEVNEATLTVDTSLFQRNVATGGAGGAIRGTKNASITIVDSIFEDNDAGGQVGGAVATGAALAISGSAFVDNRSTFTGGAVSVATTPGTATTIGSSCFVGNSDVAVVNGNVTTIDANGNWWGSTDGPGGDGSGSGDSIDDGVAATTFATEPLVGCRPLELVPNGGFDSLNLDGTPERWRLRKLDQLDDGASCAAGACSLVMVGDGQQNQALQTILISGDAGDTLAISALAGGKNLSLAGGKLQVEVYVIHADGSKQKKTLKFTASTFGDELRSKTIVASEPFVRVKVRILQSRPSGLAVFERVSVVLE